MARGKSGYNPRQNNNNISKKVESEEVKTEVEIKPLQVEENQPEVAKDIKVVEEIEIVEDTTEEFKELLNEQVLIPKEAFEFPEFEVKQTEEKSENDKWIDHVINNELELTKPSLDEKNEVEEIEDSKEKSKIPRYEFKRNEKTKKVERVSVVPKKEIKEEISQVDENSTDIEKQIAKLEQEISSMKNSLATETDDVKVFSIQKRLQIFQDNLKTLKQE